MINSAEHATWQFNRKGAEVQEMKKILTREYRVLVTDGSGAGVQGVVVRFCSDTMCLMGKTDSNGIAVFRDQAQGAYTVHVHEVPEGYAEDETEYSVPETYGDVAITLKAAQ